MASYQRQITAKRAWSELTKQRNQAFDIGFRAAIKLAYDRRMIDELDVDELMQVIEGEESD